MKYYYTNDVKKLFFKLISIIFYLLFLLEHVIINGEKVQAHHL